jgi:transposase
MNMSEVKSAFKSMKNELETRPIYHQKDGRIEVHLFYSKLAYAILKSITYTLAPKDVHISLQGIKQIQKTYNAF